MMGDREMCARLKNINNIIGKGHSAIGWGMFICVLYSKIVYNRIKHK